MTTFIIRSLEEEKQAMGIATEPEAAPLDEKVSLQKVTTTKNQRRLAARRHKIWARTHGASIAKTQRKQHVLVNKSSYKSKRAQADRKKSHLSAAAQKKTRAVISGLDRVANLVDSVERHLGDNERLQVEDVAGDYVYLAEICGLLAEAFAYFSKDSDVEGLEELAVSYALLAGTAKDMAEALEDAEDVDQDALMEAFAEHATATFDGVEVYEDLVEGGCSEEDDEEDEEDMEDDEEDMEDEEDEEDM